MCFTFYLFVAVDAKGVYYETVWKVKAYPHGCEQDVKDHLSLFITQVSGPEVFCKYSLALLTLHPFDRVPMIQGQKRGSVTFPIDKRQSSRGEHSIFFVLLYISALSSTNSNYLQVCRLHVLHTYFVCIPFSAKRKQHILNRKFQV